MGLGDCLVRHLLGERRDAAHALHEVEHHAFGAQDAVRLAAHLAEELTVGDGVAVELAPRHLQDGV